MEKLKYIIISVGLLSLSEGRVGHVFMPFG